MQDSIYQVLEEAKLSGWEQIRGCQRLRMHGGFDYKGVGGRRETFAVVRLPNLHTPLQSGGSPL